jgi:hypothetical protein
MNVYWASGGVFIVYIISTWFLAGLTNLTVEPVLLRDAWRWASARTRFSPDPETAPPRRG